MSYTNKTANYELPQWVANDKPTFLSDLNGAFSDIDTQMKANATAASSAQSTADANTSAISGITTDLDGAGGVKARLSAVETAQQGDAGNINTINSLIGNGTPTTTDQTIIGAINEIHAFTGEGPLDTTAQTVTGAINELAAGGGGSATLEGLTDVDITSPANGDALVYDSANQKWVNQAGGGSGTGGVTTLWTNPDPSQAFTTQNITLSSANYDLLIIMTRNSTSYKGFIALKGHDIVMDISRTSGGNLTTVTISRRNITYVSDTELTIGVGEAQTTGAAAAQNDSSLVPVAVYGWKF